MKINLAFQFLACPVHRILRGTTLIWILPLPKSQLVRLADILFANKGDGRPALFSKVAMFIPSFLATLDQLNHTLHLLQEP